MSITNSNQTVTVDGVQGITISPVTQDPNSGLFMRSIQVFDVPTQGQGGLTAIPKFTLIVTGSTQLAIEVQTPSFNF